MKVLFVSWELDPFIKKGGLGDVARALPMAMTKIGIDVRVVLPFYNLINLAKHQVVRLSHTRVVYSGIEELVETQLVIHPEGNVPIYFLKNSNHMNIIRDDTFPFFDMAVVEAIGQNSWEWKPDIVHCNDHHAGLIPLLIKRVLNKNKTGSAPRAEIKSILSIHNLSYHGTTPWKELVPLGMKKPWFKSMTGKRGKEKINRLMEAIMHADIITTVSPTYAKEILTKEYGMGLDEILRGKSGRVFGILNGIEDQDYWKKTVETVRIPHTKKDQSVENRTDRITGWEKTKAENKKELQRKLGLIVNNRMPLFAFIGRLDPNQKGIELLYNTLRDFPPNSYQVVVQGSGDKSWEERLQWLNKLYSRTVACHLIFDDAMAHRVYGGADFVLIPSKFEPCGLVQMIAMQYGSLPIAYETGGLKDSIRDGVNGFLFHAYSTESLIFAMRKAIEMWKNKKTVYKKMVESALTTDFSWRKSAEEYLKLYHRLMTGQL